MINCTLTPKNLPQSSYRSKGNNSWSMKFVQKEKVYVMFIWRICSPHNQSRVITTQDNGVYLKLTQRYPSGPCLLTKSRWKYTQVPTQSTELARLREPCASWDLCQVRVRGMSASLIWVWKKALVGSIIQKHLPVATSLTNTSTLGNNSQSLAVRPFKTW